MPALVPKALLQQLADDAARRRAGQVLTAVMGPGVAMYVHGSGATWAVTTGSDVWRLIGGTPVPFVPGDRHARARWFIAGGLLAATAGGTYGAAALAGQAFDDPATPMSDLDMWRTRTNTLVIASATVGSLAVGAAALAVAQ